MNKREFRRINPNIKKQLTLMMAIIFTVTALMPVLASAAPPATNTQIIKRDNEVSDLSHRLGTFRLQPVSSTELLVSNAQGHPVLIIGTPQYVEGDGVFIDESQTNLNWWF